MTTILELFSATGALALDVEDMNNAGPAPGANSVNQTRNTKPRASILQTLVVMGVVALYSASAYASPTTFQFGGSITSVDPALTSRFTTGDPISIVLSFDSSTPNVIPGTPGRAAYAYTRFDVQFGSYAVSFPNDITLGNGIAVLDNFHTALGQSDGFGPSAFGAGSGAPVGGIPLRQGFFSLFDFTQTVFSDTSLPTLLTLGDFQTRVAGLGFCSDPSCAGAAAHYVFADINSFSNITGSVPEPNSMVLLSAGLGVLTPMMFRRRSTRSGRSRATRKVGASAAIAVPPRGQ